jgi:hypothetical protein
MFPSRRALVAQRTLDLATIILVLVVVCWPEPIPSTLHIVLFFLFFSKAVVSSGITIFSPWGIHLHRLYGAMTHGLKIKKKPKQKCGRVASVDPKSPTASSTTMVRNLEQVASGGDMLIPRGLKFYDFHAMKHEEQTLGQKFSVDAWIH